MLKLHNLNKLWPRLLIHIGSIVQKRNRFIALWRHQMETFSALLAICVGNSPVPGEFHAQRPVTRSFDVFFDLRLNEPLSKQWWGWWFETLSRPLWRHCNGTKRFIFDIQHVVYIIVECCDQFLLDIVLCVFECVRICVNSYIYIYMYAFHYISYVPNIISTLCDKSLIIMLGSHNQLIWKISCQYFQLNSHAIWLQ